MNKLSTYCIVLALVASTICFLLLSSSVFAQTATPTTVVFNVTISCVFGDGGVNTSTSSSIQIASGVKVLAPLSATYNYYFWTDDTVDYSYDLSAYNTLPSTASSALYVFGSQYQIFFKGMGSSISTVYGCMVPATTSTPTAVPTVPALPWGAVCWTATSVPSFYGSFYGDTRQDANFASSPWAADAVNSNPNFSPVATSTTTSPWLRGHVNQ